MNKPATLIEGDARRFLLINTTEYNNTPDYTVRDLAYHELPEYGVTDTADLENIDGMPVGCWTRLDVGCYAMRVA